MTIDKILEKYTDKTKSFYRKSILEQVKKFRPDLDEKILLGIIPKYSLKDLKWLKSIQSKEARKLVFWIPCLMDQDANDDWELLL